MSVGGEVWLPQHIVKIILFEFLPLFVVEHPITQQARSVRRLDVSFNTVIVSCTHYQGSWHSGWVAAL